ncbi:protein-tyrosine phosphatase family protein [Herbaspirillum sp. RTI4]|uniref:protein-tyrosine phosphatase family protein n=1 Tax=Herbaspirillum sp. RTI4 TaxID=3048640 RepID=UPI002AB5A2C9|nr:protein-tyrosine phosphatase family protein [Herbaspirillum sp. RTI4]MDY7577976.1 protein-tyrosine phosphatase family protein [Herbaspirillum sp. RTI4]MEA9983445.1 protein-tyrosine phosphatase family protein [Herbaspirillum sp. RTI4]
MRIYADSKSPSIRQNSNDIFLFGTCQKDRPRRVCSGTRPPFGYGKIGPYFIGVKKNTARIGNLDATQVSAQAHPAGKMRLSALLSSAQTSSAHDEAAGPSRQSTTIVVADIHPAPGETSPVRKTSLQSPPPPLVATPGVPSRRRANQRPTFLKFPIFVTTDASRKKTALQWVLGTSETRGELSHLMEGKTGPESAGMEFLNDVAAARYPDISTARASQVVAPDGTRLAANIVKIKGINVAIASQYPKKEYLAAWFSTLLSNRTPVLVVLASDMEIDAHSLPDYFRRSGQYGEVKVTATMTATSCKNDGIDARDLRLTSYTLLLEDGRCAIRVPVLHVPHWPDKGVLKPNTLHELACRVNRAIWRSRADYEVGDPDALLDDKKLLPVIHCRAGAGRTGMLIGMLELLKSECSSVQEIVSDMRHSRSPHMVETNAQLDALADLAMERGTPLFKE